MAGLKYMVSAAIPWMEPVKQLYGTIAVRIWGHPRILSESLGKESSITLD